MWSLSPDGRPPAGGLPLAVVLVATLLVRVGPAGAAPVVAGWDGVADSDRPGEGATGSQASVGSGLAPVVDLLDQFDPEDDDDDEEEDERDEDGDDGDEDDGDDGDEDDGDDGDEDDGDDDEGEVEEGDDDDQGEGEDDEDQAEGADEVDDEEDDDGVDGAVEPDSNPDEAGDDEASGSPDPAGDGADGPSSSQVEEPSTTERPEPARLRVADLSVNRSAVPAGEPVRITATVVNDGEEAGSLDVRLRLFGEIVDARTVAVSANGDREVSFVRRIEAPGTYEASVGDASVAVSVEGSGTPNTTEAGPPSQELPGFTALVALLVVLATLGVRLRVG